MYFSTPTLNTATPPQFPASYPAGLAWTHSAPQGQASRWAAPGPQARPQNTTASPQKPSAKAAPRAETPQAAKLATKPQASAPLLKLPPLPLIDADNTPNVTKMLPGRLQEAANAAHSVVDTAAKAKSWTRKLGDRLRTAGRSFLGIEPVPTSTKATKAKTEPTLALKA